MDTASPGIKPTGSSDEELRQMMQKSKAYVDELIKENEQLRLNRADGASPGVRGPAGASGRPPLNDSNGLRGTLDRLERRVAEVEREKHQLAMKCGELTEQYESLANLYVASNQLHSTLDPAEVLRIMSEILINLIGTEEFAVFLVDRTTGEITQVTSQGCPAPPDAMPFNCEKSVLEGVIQTGEAFYSASQDRVPGVPLACVPLKIQQKVWGAIAIFSLLVQKDGLTRTDSEILSLLAGHAATAIVSARLYSDAERKLMTIEGFVDLLMDSNAKTEATPAEADSSRPSQTATKPGPDGPQTR
ncbi:MAG TPA: GAF domain-containing protein [Candidatus Sulfotelmatobacter sp.]|nr:GAF domain-containing protein [Candidatus Sulfotelmatobacter sp.]